MNFCLPPIFLARMAALLGDEYPAFLASYDASASVGLRVNTLKISVEEFLRLAPYDLTPLPWCPAGLVVKTSPPTPLLPGRGAGGIGSPAGSGAGEVGPGKHPYHAAGLYYLQDPSAMAVAELLDPRPGERVLDLAAAPGGKTTHLASLMQDQGLLVANEIHPQRAWELAGNLERWGATHAAVTVETPERLADRFPGFFDRVLLDAPCSGEGMFRKSEAARREWSPELARGCALRQAGILEHAARLVRPSGRLVYATCTFNPEENEGVLARFLADHPHFALVEPPRRPGFSAGRPDWIAAHQGKDDALPASAAPADLARAVRLWPHTGPGEGHFCAILQRRPGPEDTAPKPWRLGPLPRSVEQAYRAFCAANLTAAPAADRLTQVGAYLYALPPDLPDLAGLRYLHPGWWLGAVRDGRFIPSHALALRLRPADVQRCANLPANSPDLRAYGRGESFRSSGVDGWALVAADGFAVGWGKRVAGVVKSHYPKGLRWR